MPHQWWLEVTMKRVRIEYYDQNDDFARLMPVSGVIVRTLSDHDGRIRWVVELDQQLEYQHTVNGAGHQLIRVSELVVTSRWEGSEVGGDEPTSVHILLPLWPGATAGPSYEAHAFYHVAWGTCYTSGAA
jgi:hypothetical protein